MKRHIPVLSKEVLEYLDPKEGDLVIDATVGFGGHSSLLLKKIGTKGQLIGIDKDGEALEATGDKFKKNKNVKLVHGGFEDIEEILEEQKVKEADIILADIGVSSYQIDKAERGFSFREEGPLDMRMDKERNLSAEDIIREYSEEDLVRIFRAYGEERFAKRIARNIVEKREESEIKTTLQLKKIVEESLPVKYRKTLKIDPATKVFQALRIEVNGELEALGGFLPQAIRILKKGGRLAVISFHSLEDRMVKEFFRMEAKECICPSEFPVCRCEKEARVKILTRKPIMGSEEEIKENPRARSAKLRVIEKL